MAPSNQESELTIPEPALPNLHFQTLILTSYHPVMLPQRLWKQQNGPR